MGSKGWLLVAAVGAFACAEVDADPVADIAAVNHVREREFAAFGSGDPTALTELFTENAVVLQPNGPRVEGSEALHAWAEGFTSAFSVTGGYTGSEVEVVGDIAIERYTGRLVLTPKAGGAAVEEIVKGIHIYRRQADGSWRIEQDIWNSDAPPSP